MTDCVLSYKINIGVDYMRAIVLSDSHTNTAACERAILAIGQKNIDMIIHLGDVARDVDYLESISLQASVRRIRAATTSTAEMACEIMVAKATPATFMCSAVTKKMFSKTLITPAMVK